VFFRGATLSMMTTLNFWQIPGLLLSLLTLYLPLPAFAVCSAYTVKQQQTGIFQVPTTAQKRPPRLNRPPTPPTKQQSFQIVARYPHDWQAFTEGLVFYQGELYESTGLLGASSVRKIELKTGKILASIALESSYFGEGLTVFQQQLVQLTWKNETAFVYKIKPLQRIQSFRFAGEGWGNTTYNGQLVISNGSALLQFLTTDYRVQQVIQVKEKDEAIAGLNELEFAQEAIYANVWPTNCIAKIQPQTGAVLAWLDLSALAAKNNLIQDSLLNGIAYNPQNRHFFITGKYWPYLYEIVLSDHQ
jgi:glutamine cyclotransferase